MIILVTNDDGINAKGIHILAETLSKIATVYVAAPENNHSGAGHGLTVTVPLRANEVNFEGLSGKAWAINGTPADCVKLAMEHLLPERPDVVVSGINDGPNLGTDVLYSGTVAGAMEGHLHGLPAIAVSVSLRKRAQEANFQLAADVAGEFAAKFVAGELPCTMLNINVPGLVPEDVNGLKYTYQGWRWYNEAYDRRIDPHGRQYFCRSCLPARLSWGLAFISMRFTTFTCSEL